MKAAGVRLVTNVLCVQKDTRRLKAAEIASRLNYFQLLELCRANPNIYPPTLHYQHATPAQVAQRNAFLRERMSSLWQLRPEYVPVPGLVRANPFVPDQIAGDQDASAPVQHAEAPTSELRHEATEQEPELGEIPHDKEVADPQEEQDRVIKADPHADMFVVAPPGTGKTHVLVERLAYLVTEGIARNPFEEILVLSFTRSAVAEVRKRLIQKRDAGAHPDVVYPRVLTFDSFATQCLLMDRERDSLVGKDYRERIQLFNYLLENGLPRARETLEAVKFLLVDEVQDLTGDRAKMVLNIARVVKQSGGAVCFLGDPAQAIYDYEDDDNGGMSSSEFIGKINCGDYCAAPPARREFRHYRRFETPEMLDFVRQACAAMGPDGLHPDGGRLEELVRGLDAPCDLQELPESFGKTGSAAILTRTNLEAYQIWERCRSAGLKTELWRGSSGNYWPGWIARLVLGYQQDSMSLEMAHRRWKEHIGPFVQTCFTEAAGFLKMQGVIADDRIDLRQLNYLVSSSAPAMKKPEPGLGLVISTIHRSKGLEFDTVLIYRPRENFAGRYDEVRVIYVAATRARRQLRLINADRSIWAGAKNGHRYGLYTHHFHIKAYPKYPTIGLLIDGADEVEWTFGSHMAATDDQQETARALWQMGATGVPQNAIIERSPKTGRLSVAVGGKHICEPNRRLIEDLETIASWQRKRFIEMRNINLIDVATRAYDISSAEAQRVFGSACLGLSPVLSGIGILITGEL